MHRLTILKHPMCGRATRDLLQRRVLLAASERCRCESASLAHPMSVAWGLCWVTGSLAVWTRIVGTA
jgi:hypothetical protein